jgi:hypothetical protein
MALFSRKKSKAKKASKEEEKRAATEANSAAAPKPSQRGRNGKAIVTGPVATGEVMHDIPAPSQLPRHFHIPQDRSLASDQDRGYSFDVHNPAQDGKQEYFDPHLPSDSGYASPGQVSRGHSRVASTQQPQRDQNYLSIANKSTPQLTLGEELAQEPAFAGQHSAYDDLVNRNDGHYRNPSGGSGRSLKPSRSLQMLRNQTGADHLGPLPTTQSNQHQHQDGRQQRLIQQSMPMRPSSVPAQALQPRHERVIRPPPQRSLSPGPMLQNNYASLSPRSRNVTSPTMNSPFDWDSPASPPARNVTPSFDQDEFAPSLNILNGLKVNKRGLILDEEGDPIGELFDGDIIDCVRQKADAYGDVLDEYGRVVGRVRTLSIRSTGTSLHRSVTGSSNVERRRESSPPPPVPALRSPASPTKPTSPRSERGNVEPEDYMSMGPYDDLQGSDLPRGQSGEWALQQQEPFARRESVHGTSVSRSESLPSVPESQGTAEIVLSDNGSSASEEEQYGTTRTDPAMRDMGTPEQTFGHHSTAKSVRDFAVQQPQVMMHHEGALAGTARMGQEQPITGTLQAQEPSYVNTAPSFRRSISERGPPTDGLPPVPAVPKNFLEPKKVTYAQPVGFLATQNRGKSAPLPAFPGRGFSAGMAGSPFANGPMPGMPGMGNRRLTTPALGKMPVAGIASLSGQSPLGKPRNSLPLVRSPLSSHGKS